GRRATPVAPAREHGVAEQADLAEQAALEQGADQRAAAVDPHDAGAVALGERGQRGGEDPLVADDQLGDVGPGRMPRCGAARSASTPDQWRRRPAPPTPAPAPGPRPPRATG